VFKISINMSTQEERNDDDGALIHRVHLIRPCCVPTNCIQAQPQIYKNLSSIKWHETKSNKNSCLDNNIVLTN
jgi:hypothetical protein